MKVVYPSICFLDLIFFILRFNDILSDSLGCQKKSNLEITVCKLSKSIPIGLQGPKLPKANDMHSFLSLQ